MHVSLASSDGLERKIKVELPYDEYDKAFEQRVNELAHTAKISGFRKGKVPTKLIKQRYADSLKEEVGAKLMDNTLQAALKQIDLRPVARPLTEVITENSADKFEYAATFEVYPDINFNDFRKMNIERKAAEVTEADINNMLEKLRKVHCAWEDTDKPSALEDKLDINFDGYINDEPLEGGKAEHFEIILGSSKMIPGFEEGLIGQSAGSETTLNLHFPENYHHAAIAGKPINFNIKINKVTRPVLAELTDAFAEKLGITEGGFTALKTKTQENMTRELNKRVDES